MIERVGGEMSFHEWLVATQIEPVFRMHAFVQRALVLVIPQHWRPSDRAKTTEMMIFYSARQELDLEATMKALAEGTQDPNLPDGVSNYDLYQPIAWGSPSERRAPPFDFCTRESFVGLTPHPEHGCYEDPDAFASYTSFIRGADGQAECRRFDARLGALIDRVM